MILRFHKMTIHNFLSFGHSEVNLEGCGYCTVSGINNCEKDGAKSNGSGKSSLFSALIFALTGATTQGVTSNLKNIYIDENLCYVKLDFNADGVEYELTRYKEPKPDLKIVVDGVDKSGKGVREGEEALKRLLPDLDANLLLSVIILGQGLPHKLTSYTPSGRKDILETLSKSDYMIDDIKLRIDNRKSTLSRVLREQEDKQLQLNTKKDIVIKNISKLQELLDNHNNTNYDEQIAKKEKDIEELSSKLEEYTVEKDEKSKKLKDTNDFIVSTSNEKQKVIDDIRELMNYNLKVIDEKIRTRSSECKSMRKKLDELESIVDVCPTCGQKIPGVFKPNTTELRKQLKENEDILFELEKHYAEEERSFNTRISDKKAEYDKKISEAKISYDELYSKVNELSVDINMGNNVILVYKGELEKLNSDKALEGKVLEERKKGLEDKKKELVEIEDELANIEVSITNTNAHISVINQMNTYMKRDFRGYLLSNVIKYIDSCCKEFGGYLFGTDDLSFYLDGNNIDITFCNRLYESLSGGEKQKVDIVLQFAIRKMMSSFMNFSSNIIILDEIFDNLDSIGTGGVIDLISNKLSDIDSIFIISHHSDELQIPTDMELKIVKNNDGISEVF